MSDDITIEEGSGNVFADLGLPNPEERLAKADLVMRIAESIRARRLTQAKAAALFGSHAAWAAGECLWFG